MNKLQIRFRNTYFVGNKVHSSEHFCVLFSDFYIVMIVISADVHGTGHNDAKVIVIYLVPRANYPLGPFLISRFLPPVGRHLVRILSPDFSSGCLLILLLIHNNWLFVLKLKVLTVFVSITYCGRVFHKSSLV